MTPASAVLAVIPPFFAIFVELLNPISERSISHSVQKDLENYKVSTAIDYNTLTKQVESIVGGAVEVAGLAPTFVASLTSGFSVLNDLPNPWVIVGYILVFLALLLFLLHYLSGQTYLQMSDTKQPIELFGYKVPVRWHGTSIVSALIYIANLLLILFVVIIFAVTREHAPSMQLIEAD
jgi:hypothetical protein